MDRIKKESIYAAMLLFFILCILSIPVRFCLGWSDDSLIVLTLMEALRYYQEAI
jgi:hypothetical protein